jgi:hypothetical protein
LSMAGEPRHRTGRSLLVGVAIGSPSGVNFHRSKYSPNMSARLPRVRCDAVALGVNISVSAPFRSAVPYWFDHVPVFTPRSSVGSRAGALLWPRGPNPHHVSSPSIRKKRSAPAQLLSSSEMRSDARFRIELLCNRKRAASAKRFLTSDLISNFRFNPARLAKT